MFPMTITIQTPAQFHAVVNALKPDLQASDFADPAVGAAYVEAAARVSAAEKQAVTSGKPKAEKTAAAKTEPAAPSAPTAAAEPAAAPETKADDSAPAPTYDDVKRAILDVSKTKGRDAAIALLKQFGAEKGPDLQASPEKFGLFIAAAKAALS